MISFSGRRSFPPTGFHSGIFVGTVTVASIQISANHFTDKPPRTIGRAMRRWTVFYRPRCPLPSHDGPRSLVQAGLCPIFRVSLHLEKFPSSDKHNRRQISQMDTKWSRIRQRNPSQIPQALSTLSLIVLRERCCSPESSSQHSSPSQRRSHRISGRARETYHEQRPLLRRHRRRPTLPDSMNYCKSCLF